MPEDNEGALAFDSDAEWQRILEEDRRYQEHKARDRQRLTGDLLDIHDRDLQRRDENVLSDMARGVGNGVVGFGQSIGSLLDAGSEALFDYDLIDDEILGRKAFGETGLAGSLVSGLVQFGMSLALPGAAFGRLGGLLKLGAKGKQIAKFGAADFFAFKGDEGRLSDLFKDTALENPLTTFLSTEEGDGEFEGRIKNVMEGMGIGAVAGLVFKPAKALKQVAAQTDEAKRKHMLKLLQTELANDADLLAQSDLLEKYVRGEAELVFKSSVTEEGAKEGARFAMLGDESIQSIQERVVKHFRSATGENVDPEQVMEGIGGILNVKHIGDSKSADALIEAVGEALRPAIQRYVKPISNPGERMIALMGFSKALGTDSLGLDPDVVAGMIRGIDTTGEGMQNAVQKMLQGKILLEASAQQSQRFARILATDQVPVGPMRDQIAAEFHKSVAMTSVIAGSVKKIVTTGARITQAGNIDVKGLGQALDSAKTFQALKDSGATFSTAEDSLIAKFAMMSDGFLEGDLRSAVEVVDEVTTKSKFRKGQEVVNEYYVNGLLAGLTTQSINFSSNLVNLAVIPAERMLGGALHGSMSEVRQGLNTYVGYAAGTLESIKMMSKAFRTGEGILDPGTSKLTGLPKSISAENLGVLGTSLAPAVDFLGTITRLPSRALNGTDELFKQLTYRADLYARFSEEALGKNIPRGEMGAYVAKKMQKKFAKTGEAIDAAALAEARRNTFTTPLVRGGMSHKVQQFTNAHPTAKMFVPFIRTPVNIIDEALARTPLLSKISHLNRQALASGDPRKIAEVTGRTAMGNTMFAGAAMLAVNGNLSGYGPRDPEERARKMLSGWRPYSVKIGDSWIDMSRMDPWGSVLGLAADYAAIAADATEEDQMEFATAAMSALSENFVNKTYMKGMTDVLNAVMSPDRHQESWFQSFSSSFVPNILAPRQSYGFINEEALMREVKTVSEAILKKIPGSSQNLDPKRNLLGQPIELDGRVGPVNVSSETRDPVRRALAELPIRTAQPAKIMQGIKLEDYLMKSGQSAYNRLQELTGTLSISGNDLEEALAKLIESDKFVGQTPERQALYVERELSRYRAKARKTLLREIPELRHLILNERTKIKEARRAKRVADFQEFINN